MNIADKYLNSNSEKYVFLFHGLLGSVDDWKIFIEAYKKYYNIFSFKLFGHPGCDNKEFKTCNLVSLYVEEVMKVIESYSIVELILVGNSIGGIISLELSKKLHFKCKVVLINVATKQFIPNPEKYVNTIYNYKDIIMKKHYRKMFATKLEYIENLKLLNVNPDIYARYMNHIVSCDYTNLHDYVDIDDLYVFCCYRVFVRNVKKMAKYGYSKLPKDQCLFIKSNETFIIKNSNEMEKYKYFIDSILEV